MATSDFELVNAVFNAWAFEIATDEVRIIRYGLDNEDRVTFANISEVNYTPCSDRG